MPEHPRVERLRDQVFAAVELALLLALLEHGAHAGGGEEGRDPRAARSPGPRIVQFGADSQVLGLFRLRPETLDLGRRAVKAVGAFVQPPLGEQKLREQGIEVAQ